VIVEILVVSALLSAVWVGSGKVPAARPYRAGVAGAARASWSAGSTVALDRWATGSNARATRRQARATRWGRHWYGRATLRAEHGLVRPVGRGLAVAGPAAWAGAKAAREGWATAYRAERDRRATGPDADAGPTDGPVVDQVGQDDSSQPADQPTDQQRPTLAAVPTTEETTVPTTTEITDLQSLVAVLTGIEALAEQMVDVSQAARATHETALMEFDFNPGSAVAGALQAASEAAPQWFDADAWLSAIAAARREAEALMSQATEIADTGAAGRLDQLAAS